MTLVTFNSNNLSILPHSTPYDNTFFYNYRYTVFEGDVGMKKNQLDQQWFTLILEAKKIGLSVEEIRSFLHSTSAEELTKISSITLKT